MKNVILNDIGRENEFRPNSMYKKYLDMIERDVKKEFPAGRLLPEAQCPACLSKSKTAAFRKFGFQYVECRSCGTVYMTPRPNDSLIKAHYLKSPSTRFWKKMTSKTRGKRKEKIYDTRIEWMREVVEEYLPAAKSIGDFNSKDIYYVDELIKSDYFEKKLIINPYFEANELSGFDRQKNIAFVDEISDINKIKNKIDVIAAFVVLDLTSDVGCLMRSISRLLADNGLFFMTTVSISGFDLQTLWENSPNIFPPDRINVFSQNGLKLLFKRYGLEMLEYSTPGLLDLDIVRNAFDRNPDLPLPRFVKTMFKVGNEQLFRDFQDFLQINKLSSFVRIVLRKNKE